MITRLKISRFKGLQSAEIELGGHVVFYWSEQLGEIHCPSGSHSLGRGVAALGGEMGEKGSRREFPQAPESKIRSHDQPPRPARDPGAHGKAPLAWPAHPRNRQIQQVTLLLCFLLQNPGAILLLDEPDAHLEILRQRDIYTLLTELAAEQRSQIIAASHSSTVMQVAGEKDVLVAFLGAPHRVDTRASQNQVKKSLESIPLSDFYLVTRESLLAYITSDLDPDDLFSAAERDRRIDVMTSCIEANHSDPTMGKQKEEHPTMPHYP